MGEITLKNGKVLTIDVSDLTVKEWRSFLRGTESDENTVISKCTGLPIAEIEKLNYRQEFKPIVKDIIKKCQEPLADPNSQSASTSTE